MAVQPDSPGFEQNLEGQQFKVEDAELRNKVIEWAFDYRGDVTLGLRSGERLEGYVYHRNSHGPFSFSECISHQSGGIQGG